MDDEILIYICDDERTSIAALEHLIRKENVPGLVIKSFRSGEELLPALDEQLPDLLILDILMKGMTGIETLRKIREVSNELPVAFCTSSKEYALDGYRLKAVRYLEKPATPEDVHDLIQFIVEEQKKKPMLYIGEEALDLRDILYMEQKNHNVEIHLSNASTRLWYGKLDSLQPYLTDSFVRCHKSFIVNLQYVIGFDRELSVFTMKNGDMAYIRRADLPAMKRRYEAIRSAKS